MKNLLIIALLASLTPAATCFGAADGGSDRGGGDVKLRRKEISPYDIEASILDSKSLVNSRINALEKHFLHHTTTKEDCAASYKDENDLAILRKLFQSKPNLRDVAESTKVHFERGQACRDKNGNPVQASIYSNMPGTICVSSFLLAKELRQDELDHQTAALMLHELGHLILGDNEEAPEKLQEDFLDALETSPIGRKMAPPLGKAEAFSKAFKNIKKSPRGICKNIKVASKSYESVIDALNWKDKELYNPTEMQVFPTQQMDEMDMQAMRLNFITRFVCAKDPTISDRDRKAIATENTDYFNALMGDNVNFKEEQLENVGSCQWTGAAAKNLVRRVYTPAQIVQELEQMNDTLMNVVVEVGQRNIKSFKKSRSRD